jgi:putative thioredoxin
LLEIVQRDRAFDDDLGRRKMLAVFEMAAGEPDLVSEFRRRLSATLY